MKRNKTNNRAAKIKKNKRSSYSLKTKFIYSKSFLTVVQEQFESDRKHFPQQEKKGSVFCNGIEYPVEMVKRLGRYHVKTARV